MLSYSLQHLSINLIIELKDRYEELLIAIAAYLKSKRDCFPTRTIVSSVNILIYQTQAFQQFQSKYLDTIENILFSMTLIPYLIEADLKQCEIQDTESVRPYQRWSEYCLKKLGWIFQLSAGDHGSGEIHEETLWISELETWNCLSSYRNSLCKRFSIRTTGMFQSYIETSFDPLLDEMKGLIDTFRTRTHSTHSRGCEVHIPMTNALYRYKALEILNSIRTDIRELWFTDTVIGGGRSYFLSQMKRLTESLRIAMLDDKEDEDDIRKRNVWMTGQGVEWYELQYQTSCYHDIAICCNLHVIPIQTWMTCTTTNTNNTNTNTIVRDSEWIPLAIVEFTKLFQLRHRYSVLLQLMNKRYPNTDRSDSVCNNTLYSVIPRLCTL